MSKALYGKKEEKFEMEGKLFSDRLLPLSLDVFVCTYCISE